MSLILGRVHRLSGSSTESGRPIGNSPRKKGSMVVAAEMTDYVLKGVLSKLKQQDTRMDWVEALRKRQKSR